MTEDSSAHDVTRLLLELRQEQRGARTLLFWGFGLALAAFAGLMVFFILYLNAARTNLESSIAEGLPGFGREMAGLIQAELADGQSLQKEVVELGNRADGLADELSRAQAEIATLKKKEREHRRLLDLRRAELETQTKMYEELVALVEASGTAGAGAASTAEETGSGEQPDSGDDGSSAMPLPESRRIIAELNRLFESAGLRNVRIAEFVSLSGRGLEKPVISVQGFKGKQTAVLSPEYLRVYRKGDNVLIRTGGVGKFTPLGESAQPLEPGAVETAVLVEQAEGLSHPGLRRLAGLEPLREVATSPDSAAGEGASDLLSGINDVLSRERGRQFRFSAIESVEDSQLHNVCFDSFDTEGVLQRTVEATGCRIKLYVEDRYVEVHFEDGFIIQDKKRIPFYNDQYRLTLPNIDPKVWQQAGLDFIVEN